MPPNKIAFTSPLFTCHLHCGRCTYRKPDGQRCKNRVCHGIPTCWIHTKKEYKVQRKDSDVHGKGLFTTEDIAANEWICPYGGQRITRNCLNRRYGDNTAPYAASLNTRQDIDGACRRGTGCVANGKFRANGRSQSIRSHNATIEKKRGDGLWLYSTKSIKAGREIFVHYGNEYTLQDNHTTTRKKTFDTRPC